MCSSAWPRVIFCMDDQIIISINQSWPGKNDKIISLSKLIIIPCSVWLISSQMHNIYLCKLKFVELIIKVSIPLLFRRRLFPSPSLSHIEFKYDSVFLLVLMPCIGFCYYPTHALIEQHGILIVRTAIADKTADLFLYAVVLYDRKGLYPDPFVLVLSQYIQRM